MTGHFGALTGIALGNIFGAPIEEVRFARDSPLEEAVSSEPVSESPKFPASLGKYREFCSSGPPRAGHWFGMQGQIQ